MKKYFGTDGIRGRVNQKLTAQLALSLGLAVGRVLSEKSLNKKLVVIGRDSRNSGIMLEQAISAGLLSQGFDVVSLGMLPTPAVAYLTKYFKADLGIVISASHNPFWDNGIKFFNHEGRKLDDTLEAQVEEFLDEEAKLLDDINLIGNYKEKHDAIEIYLDYLSGFHKKRKNYYKVVIDSANGALSDVSEKFFKKLGYEVIAIGNKPTGTNINLNCGSTHLDKLKDMVIEQKADLGFAFDGDADRFLVVDSQGEILDGDELLFLYAKYLQKNNLLANNLVVATVMSNLGLAKALENYGISLIETKVGDRYVSEGMQIHQGNLGGEQSGHLIFSDYNTTGDGLLSAIMLLNILNSENQNLYELKSEMIKYPQTLVNVYVSDKTGWDTNSQILEVIKEQEEKIAHRGRVLVRASGTENLIRIMVEGENLEEINTIAETIANVVRDEL